MQGVLSQLENLVGVPLDTDANGAGFGMGGLNMPTMAEVMKVLMGPGLIWEGSKYRRRGNATRV